MIANSRKVRLASAVLGFSSIELMIWLWISCNFVTLAFSQNNFYTSGRYGKREESAAPVGEVFLAGSRYGRSGMMTMKNSRTGPKVSDMAPRVDRFYTGSRYGKRAHSQFYNAAALRDFEEVLNYLDRMQHIKKEDRMKYDRNKENNEDVDKQDDEQNPLVLCEMFNTSRC
ncbi:uncharacterized protein LOC122506448 [Leptopilina heterotoma]|uniref:uncharacterized protein LOC122506448 n=1 Tax=Leptopilina heterotoma TaxID=63436 RepID=UPI001CA98497|nr:uncharacterized protein LOC122506448 [Leptopilina heterotoma]XP_043474569.1 uncharacterized protein LOC122506448 [Leptopilina heterotoma]XP_043474570.1 uncharacterized protein LOC122506448 [Leptopilina heterotoma]